MVIGIDFDGVLFDSENLFKVYSEFYDIEIGGSGVKHRQKLKASDRYAWTKEQAHKFIHTYILKCENEAAIMDGALYVINKLQKMGHTFIGITARGLIESEEIDISKRRLKELGLDFEVFYSVEDKAAACIENHIDVMIEDHINNIIKISDAGIKCLYFTDLQYDDVDIKNVKQVYNWGEVYRELLKEIKHI